MSTIPGAPAAEQAATQPPTGAAPGERVCPRRRSRLLAVVALASALGVATASTDENEPARVDDGGTAGEGGATTEAEQPDVFAVGDTVQLGDWQVRVHGVTDPVQSTNPVITPAAGNRWVAVDVEVTNTGTEAQTVSSLVCFEIVDDQNRSYSLTITAEGGSSPPDGEVAAGASRRGTLTYEVPEDAAGLRLTFRCDLFSTGSATIALG